MGIAPMHPLSGSEGTVQTWALVLNALHDLLVVPCAVAAPVHGRDALPGLGGLPVAAGHGAGTSAPGFPLAVD